jgi:serine/threonine protein kinase
MNRIADLTVPRGGVASAGWSDGNLEATAPRILKQRFVLEELLGSGGMGSVFRARDLRKVEAGDRNPYVAIKVLNNDFRAHPEAFVALQREAARSQALSHPNIVSIFDFDKDGDLPFIIMELLDGQELAALLRAFPTGLPDDAARAVIGSVCAALAHAHGRGLVHADLKPGNIFVAPDRQAKLLDFGLARAVATERFANEAALFDPDRLGALTPAYSSPERLAGAAPSPADDIFALGIVVYLILTGRHPFDRLRADEAAAQGIEPERPRGLGWRQWRVLRRCLDFRCEARPASALQVAREFPLRAGGRGVDAAQGPRRWRDLFVADIDGRQVATIAIVALSIVAAVSGWLR